MKTLSLIPLLIFCSMFLNLQPADAVILDVYRDGYIEDYTRDNSVDPDGIPDRISDSNALLSGRGNFISTDTPFNVNSRSIMTFDIAPYSGQSLQSALISFYTHRTDVSIYSNPDSIIASLYGYAGDGLVDFDDFDSPANFLGDFNVPPFTIVPDPNSDFGKLQRTFIQLDITGHIQSQLSLGTLFSEFRVESDSFTVYISAGESADYTLDQENPGPRLTLNFLDPAAAVPEPTSLMLLSLGLTGLFFRRNLLG